MSVAWILAPVLVLAGTGLLLALLRGVDEATGRTRSLLDELTGARPATAELRVETARMRASRGRLHRR